jgi:NADH:ubiquinone reductase (H+-translocating)
MMSQRILIVGAGFAGMWSALGAARVLDSAGRTDGSIEIALIAPEPFLHMRPRFHEAGPAEMRTPLAAIFDAVGVRYIQGSVERIRTEANEVDAVSADGTRQTIHYDRLVLAAGSHLFRPAIPGLQEFGFSVDQLKEAVELEAHLASLARLPDTPGRNTVVVAGGGFTGIEIAAEMPGRLRAIIGQSADIKVVVVEQAADIGPDLGPNPRPVITRALRELGVTWRTGSAITAVDANGASTANGERIEARTVIWTAGLRASPLTAQIPAPRDSVGRLHVTTDLRVVGLDNVFATGDMAFAATDDDGNHAMMSCQHALTLGRFSGHNVAANLLGLPTLPYRQPRYVTCLDLGPWGAVYSEGWDRQVKLSGHEAKQLKQRINTVVIYPPPADRDALLAAASPTGRVAG